MSHYSDYMNNLNPAAWWRLGETSGSTAQEEENNLDGTYKNTPSLGKSGAIANDSNKSVLFNQDQSEYVEVSNSQSFSLVRGHDTFSRFRLPSSSWGTAESGGSWTAEVSSGWYYSCVNHHARINQTGASGTWQQGLNISRKYYEIQCRVRWDDHAAGGTLKPLMLVGRRQDNNNYYRAQLQENTDESLDLLLVKVINGTATVLATASNIGTYIKNDWWYVRFRLDGTTLSARAWKEGIAQPTSWDVSVTDSSISSAGTVSIRSSNSGTKSHPKVEFDDFWVQCLGMTVQFWLRPWTLSFSTISGSDYIYLMGKGKTGEQEWALRFYDDSSGRPNRISAYMFNLSGGLGAGAYWQPSTEEPIADNTWYQIVAVFDPGDQLDQNAGISLFKNGSFKKGPRDGYKTSPGTFYRWDKAPITPGRGTAKLRLATRSKDGYFHGRLDEVAIFDRALSDTEISTLYYAAT